MKYRELGKTGLKVSEIGMGTWQLSGKPWGWSVPDEKESLKALYKYVELGGNFIDTAWVYGRHDEPDDPKGGTPSEEFIGKFVKKVKCRDKVILASKIPPKDRNWPARKGVQIKDVFPDRYIEEMVNSSLTHLGIDTIDLMQFHVWQDYFVNDDGWKNTIQKITKKGKVRFWGLSINDYQPSNCLKTLDTGLISTIQFIFNIFHQKPEEKLLPYAKAKKIGLIARVPFDEGSLTGKLSINSKFDDPLHSVYFRQDRLEEFIPRLQKLEQLLGKEAQSLPDLSLRWILSHEEVSTVIPGTRKVKYAIENASVSDGKKLSGKLLDEIKKHKWERNFMADQDPSLESDGYIEK